MATVEIPSDDEVVAALRRRGERVTARDLCLDLMQRYPIGQVQLAIQRAAERGRLLVNPDWSLSAAHEVVAA